MNDLVTAPSSAKLEDIRNLFVDYGESIAKSWQAYDYDEAVLPRIAAEVLTRRPLASRLSPWAIAEAFVDSRAIDYVQSHTPFSDFQCTVYKHPRFFIEVLHWINGTTTIHNHPFSGAFQLLSGRSINTEYSFQEIKRVQSRFRLGELMLKNAELLTRGDVREIESGDRFIHAAFHLDKPSVTAVVRTYQDPDATPQLEYRPPYIALEPNQMDPVILKRFQAVSLLQLCGADEYRDKLLSSFRNATIDDTYWLLRGLDFSKMDESLESAIYEIVHEKDYGKHIIETIEQEKITRAIVSLRGKISDERLRLFLACLLNIQARSDLLKFLQSVLECEDLGDETFKIFTKLQAQGVLLTSATQKQLYSLAQMLCSGKRTQEEIGSILVDDPLGLAVSRLQ